MKHLVNSREKFASEVERKAYKKDANGIKTVANPELVRLLEDAKSGKIKLQDHTYVMTAYVSGLSSVSVLDESDLKIEGLRNIAAAKLPKGEYFVPVAITMLAATCDSNSVADMQAAPYLPIDGKKAIGSGSFTLTVNKDEKVVNEDSTAKFSGLTYGSADAPAGTIILDNTTVIKPEERIELNLKFGTTVPATDKIAVKFLLHGTRTASAAL